MLRAVRSVVHRRPQLATALTAAIADPVASAIPAREYVYHVVFYLKNYIQPVLARV
jgi:hypothetical protein